VGSLTVLGGARGTNPFANNRSIVGVLPVYSTSNMGPELPELKDVKRTYRRIRLVSP